LISQFKVLFIFLLVSAGWAQSQASTITPRIIGGVDFTEEYPWMVAVQSNAGFCGGTLIHKDWVLTAAHCVQDVTADQVTLWVGAQDLTKVSAEGSQVERHTVDWLSSHSDFTMEALSGDIAILKLSQSSSKTPLKLITPELNSTLANNDSMRVIGWGLTDFIDKQSLPDILQEVDLSFKSDGVCDATYPGAAGGYWHQGICAGEALGGKDSCSGDSGGPLLLWENGEWLLTGIVSWGVECGTSGKYGVYAEVAYYLDWIEQRQTGVTIIGADKIGFLGEGRIKSDVYKLVNSGDQAVQVMSKGMLPTQIETFAIDDNSLLIDTLAANSEVEFTINALGNISGEHDSKVQIQVDDYLVEHKLNAKVLNPLGLGVSSVDWPFFSGTNEQTEHAQPWYVESDAQQGAVLRSGSIGNEERSVLVTYLAGSGNTNPFYLKFDFKVDSDVNDGLLVVINQGYPEEQVIFLGAGQNDWETNEVPLLRESNHVLFIYVKDDEFQSGSDSAYLANFRICTDITSDPNEGSCARIDQFYNPKSKNGLGSLLYLMLVFPILLRLKSRR